MNVLCETIEIFVLQIQHPVLSIYYRQEESRRNPRQAQAPLIFDDLLESKQEKEVPRSRKGDRPKLERSLTQNLEEPKARMAVKMKAMGKFDAGDLHVKISFRYLDISFGICFEYVLDIHNL